MHLGPLPFALAACLLVVPVPARAASYWDEQPLSSSQVRAGQCHPQLFVGVRGSGEPAPFGHTIERVRKHLSAVVPVRTRVTWVDYPAVSPHSLGNDDLASQMLDQEPRPTSYSTSVRTGTQQLEQLLDWSATRCPGQKVVLVGFSQGAEVITTTLAASSHRASVAATILLGNPAHFPGQNVRELDQQVDTPAIGLVSTMEYLRVRALPTSTTDHRTAVHNLVVNLFRLNEGAVSTAELSSTLQGGHEVLPATSYATTFSVCRRDDLVCDAAPALSRVLTSTSTLPQEFTRSRPVHNGYTPEAASQTLTEVARILNGRPQQTASPSPAPGNARRIGPRMLPGAIALSAAGALTAVTLGLVVIRIQRRRR